MVADPLARSYVHKDLALPPLTRFQVKVKAFNSKGEGPFSLTAVIYSAQDGESTAGSRRALSPVSTPTLFHLAPSVLLSASSSAAVALV